MIRAAALAAVLCVSPAHADQAVRPNVEILAEHGLLVLQGPKDARRVAAAHWRGLEALGKAAPSCLTLAEEALRAGNDELPAQDPDLSECRALRGAGPMTPGLRALAGTIAALRAERRALAAMGGRRAAPGASALEAPWARETVAPRRGDALEDAAPLVGPLFAGPLAGPRPEPDAARRLSEAAAARGVTGLATLISSDAVRGAPSEELRAQLRLALLAERRALTIARAQKALADALASKRLRRELDELAALSRALTARPGLVAELEQAAAAPPSGAVPRLRSAGLHLQDPTRLGQYELGDEISFSGAYWVDGLPEGASVPLEETTFLETADGFAFVETRAVKRGNGGPYPYARKIRLDSSQPRAARASVSAAAAAPLAERVEVPVAADFELALRKEAAAAGLAQSCDFKGGEAAYAAIEALVAEAAKVKPQYKTLLSRARAGRERAAKDAAALTRLEESVGAARVDSSPEQCQYTTRRVDEALKLARALPPGCDRVLPELTAQRLLIARRADDQDWFRRALADARARRKACALDAAHEGYARALAVLEAGPAARCGRTAEDANAAEAEREAVARDRAWKEEFARLLAAAETRTEPEKRLDLLRPLLARLPALDAAPCLRDEHKRARARAEEAGRAATGTPDADARRRLPAETTLAAVSAEVRRERARLLEAAATRARAAAEAQAPAAALPASLDDMKPSAAASVPGAKRPGPAKSKAKKRTKK